MTRKEFYAELRAITGWSVVRMERESWPLPLFLIRRTYRNELGDERCDCPIVAVRNARYPHLRPSHPDAYLNVAKVCGVQVGQVLMVTANESALTLSVLANSGCNSSWWTARTNTAATSRAPSSN